VNVAIADEELDRVRFVGEVRGSCEAAGLPSQHHQPLRLYGKELRPGRFPIVTVTVRHRDASRSPRHSRRRPRCPWWRVRRGSGDSPKSGLLARPEDERGISLPDARSTGPAVRVRPVPSDEGPVPAQQGCRLDEEASETPAGEELRQPGQHRSVRQAPALVGGPGGVGVPPPRGGA